MKSLDPELGKRLYELLPAVYRERDNSSRSEGRGDDRYDGDLGRYLAGFGVLLDRTYRTLEQRFADAFPDTPEEGRPPQDWVLPYLAQLLDARLVSPHAAGRRAEIANAVAWRQRKGTVAVIEDVAEKVGQLEVEVQEGWRRVARTARIGFPLLSAHSLGYAHDPDPDNPSQAAKHPGLPTATVDLRCPSTALEAEPGSPGARTTRFEGVSQTWRQGSYHGVPCYPGSFDDVSPRTVDLRSPDWRVGHHHPRRVLLYTPPPAGFFPPSAVTIQWSNRHDHPELFEEFVSDDGVRVFRNRSHGSADFVPLKIRGVIELNEAQTFRFEGLHLDNHLEVDNGRVEAVDCALRSLHIHTIDTETPTLTAQGCLFKSLQNARGLSRMVFCTVLQQTLSEVIEASDCVFLGRVRRHHEPLVPPLGCLRYSRIEPWQPVDSLATFSLTRKQPVFFSLKFGQRGCGVLHPAAPEALRFGAEDGGELGAYHDWFYTLQEAAVLEKLKDFLPLGMEAVLIPDAHLLDPPA
mgnify:CR=1 FL=1